jgi:hypothetical protein
MLARRAADILGRCGIEAEVFRDEDVFRAAQAQFATSEKIAYMNLARFDPDAFGVLVARDRVEEARGTLAREGLDVALLEIDPDRSVAPLDPLLWNDEADAHPYRGALVRVRRQDAARFRRPLVGAIALGLGLGLAFLFAPRAFSCGATVHDSLP